jgi:hypothetical protein
MGSCHDGRLDLIYYQDPGLKEGESFPLWMAQVAAAPTRVRRRRFGFLSSAQRLGDGIIDNRFSTGCVTRGVDCRGRDHAGWFRGRRDFLCLLYCAQPALRRGGSALGGVNNTNTAAGRTP